MAIEFVDSIQPIGSSNFFLLDDKYLKGGLHVVATKAELSLISAEQAKLGMLVAVTEEDGTLYECTKLELIEDEFGDLVATVEFTAISLDTVYAPRTAYARPTQEINFMYMSPSEVHTFNLDMGCTSFVLASLEVPVGRKVKITIGGKELNSSLNSYSFSSTRKNLDDGSTYMLNRTRFQYRKFNIISNLDTVNPTIFKFDCMSLEDAKYYASRNLSMSQVLIKLSYIPLNFPLPPPPAE